jgi:hypothetical protein
MSTEIKISCHGDFVASGLGRLQGMRQLMHKDLFSRTIICQLVSLNNAVVVGSFCCVGILVFLVTRNER